MNDDASEIYKNSEYLRKEATRADGVFVDEVWEAVVAREVIIDQLAKSGAVTVDNIKSSGYFPASKLVRSLQDAYGIERYPELDE